MGRVSYRNYNMTQAAGQLLWSESLQARAKAVARPKTSKTCRPHPRKVTKYSHMHEITSPSEHMNLANILRRTFLHIPIHHMQVAINQSDHLCYPCSAIVLPGKLNPPPKTLDLPLQALALRWTRYAGPVPNVGPLPGLSKAHCNYSPRKWHYGPCLTKY